MNNFIGRPKGLKNKLDKIQIELVKLNPGIVIITEHDLTNFILNTDYLSGYNLKTS